MDPFFCFSNFVFCTIVDDSRLDSFGYSYFMENCSRVT